MKKICLLLSFLSLVFMQSASAQQLLTENFSYAQGQALTANGWTQIGAVNTNPVLVTPAGLSYAGYQLSGRGNAAALVTSGQDVYLDAASGVTSGNLYTSFMLNVVSAQAAGDYFFALLPQTSTTGFVGRIYIKSGVTGYYKIGISKGATDQPVYGKDSFDTGVTSLVVLKYEYIAGATNDSVRVYNFTSGVPATEPRIPTTVTSGGSATADATTLGRIALRQGTATLAAALAIDGIRVATTWADLNAVTTPNAASSPVFTATGLTSATISWVKGAGYNNATQTQLVYVKALTGINGGVNTLNPVWANADSNFAGAGSGYPNDMLAKCVYNGDSTRVGISGLEAGTPYYAAIYTVNNGDSVYSGATLINGITNSAGPATVTSLSFVAGSSTSATISWIKPATYNNSNYTTLLFVKEATAINNGVASKNPASYTGSADFNITASVFEKDSLAHCAYVGDSSSVSITGLKPATLYYVMNYVVSNADSLYSNPAVTGGATKPTTLAGATFAAFTGLTGTIARISWVKPAGYVNASFTTLVFVKPADSINVGVPTRNPARYTAAPAIQNGSAYQHDVLAHCVFKADTNFVNITGLAPASKYYAVVFIVRDADSVYSPETVLNGMSLGAPPHYTIAAVSSINTTTGVIDSNNVRATLRGIVYGINLRATGVQFLMKDGTGGIMVLNTTKDFGYKANEGDSIEVQGVMSQNRGWTNIGTLDTIIYLGSGNAVKSPGVVTQLNESTENDMLMINNLNLVTPIAAWPVTGSVRAYRTGTTDTFNIRIINTTTVAGSAAPTGEFSVIGIGAQQSSSANAPFAFNGYQIVPLGAEYIIPVQDTLSAFTLIIPSNNAVVNLKGDTALKLSVTFTGSVAISSMPVPSYRFLLDYPTGNFGLPLVNILLNGGTADTSAKILYTTLANSFPNLHYGDSLMLKYTIIANSGSYKRMATQAYNITLKRGAFTGLNQIEPEQHIAVSPNPASGSFMIESPWSPEWVQVIDITGKLVQQYETAASYPVGHLPAGLYFVKMKIGDQLIAKKLMINN